MSGIKKKKTISIFDSFVYIFMIICAVLFIYPFWQTLVLSISTPEEATKLGLKFFPAKISLEAYKLVLKSEYIYIGYFNTIFRTVIGTTLSVFFTYFGAYALSKKKLPFRNAITLFILFTMFFSGGLIPTYLLMMKLGLIGSRWVLILPLLTSAWYLIIARNFIMTIPESMEESAFIDGASLFTVIFKIILPLSMPIIAVLALWNAVGHWNAWFDAYIYLRDSNKLVLQLILRRLILENELSSSGDRSLIRVTSVQFTPESVIAATIMVAIAPIIAFYPFLQKYFVQGIMVGALKG